MSKYFVLAAALIVLAIACNKKEEAPATETTVEQSAPEEAPMEAAPEAMDESHVEEAQ